jgi:ribonucleotide reductase beta subunit family protein with ferritin-like domain
MSTDNSNDCFDLIVGANNFTFHPINNRWFYDHLKTQQATYWLPESIDYSLDRDDYEKKLNEGERYVVRNILAFFAAADGIVAKNINTTFIDCIEIKEVQQVFRYQAMIEDIHSETYSLLLDTIIREKEEKTVVLNAINTIPAISKKAAWAQKWTNDANATIAHQIISMVCVEGIQFQGSFCAIFWLKKRGLMPALIHSNESISREEEKHTETWVNLYRSLKQEFKLAPEVVVEIVREAVEIEIEFIIDSIPCALLGMNSSMMRQYIYYIADQLLYRLIGQKEYKVGQPFDFMESMSIEVKTNFFERRVADYNKAGSSSDTADSKKIRFDDDF